jgi:hypothetical protein
MRVRTSPAEKGMASHLCGSKVTESACSIPCTRLRCWCEKRAAAP